MVASMRAVSGMTLRLVPGVEDAHGQDHGIEHVELAGDHDLQGGHHFGGRGDRVLGRVRGGAVAAGAQHGDNEPVRGAEHDARLGAERAVRLEGGEHVHAVGGVHPAAGGIQHAFADHVARAVEAFLARLEHQHDIAGQLVPAFGEERGRAGEHGGVEVVAAGVHGAVDRGGVVHAGLFLDGKPVHVRAEEHRRGAPAACGPPAGARRNRRAAVAPPRRTAVTDVVLLAQRDFVRQAVQRLQHLFLGSRQLQADLRLPVQVVAEPGKVSPASPGRLRQSACVLLVCGSGVVGLF